MSEQIDWERLARFVSGESSAAESAEVRRWMSESEANRTLVSSLQRRWELSGTPEVWDVDRAWKGLSARLSESAGASERPAPFVRSITAKPTRSWAIAYLPIAAGVVAVAGLSLYWRSTAHSPNGREPGSIALANIEERTGAGERRVVNLPDGSRATLGAESELRVMRGFGDRDRDVFLTGEAIFTVHHDSIRPFRVHAGGAVAEDIGTSFSVRSYEDDHSVRVVVAEGAVSLRRAKSESASAVTLRARDVARLTPTGEPVVLHAQPVERILSWANGELVFDDAQLGDIVAELERWYGVKITLADPQLAQRHYSATFRGDSLDAVLQVISIGLDLQVERDANKVTLRPGRRAAAPRRSALTSHRVEVGV